MTLRSAVEREDLEAAGVSEHGARPTDEAMQAAHAANGLVAGTQIEVVGVAEDDFGAERFEGVLRDGLDGSRVPTGMKTGVSTVWMGQIETAAAAAGGGFRENLKLRAHQRFYRGNVESESGARQLTISCAAEVNVEIRRARRAAGRAWWWAFWKPRWGG